MYVDGQLAVQIPNQEYPGQRPVGHAWSLGFSSRRHMPSHDFSVHALSVCLSWGQAPDRLMTDCAPSESLRMFCTLCIRCAPLPHT